MMLYKLQDTVQITGHCVNYIRLIFLIIGKTTMDDTITLHDHNYSAGRFREQLDQISLSLSDDQIKKFILTYEMLVETNKVMNLTAITEYDEVITKHFIDSLSLVRLKNIREKLFSEPDLKVIDMGTGAGFPGIPLAIAFPNVCFVLADSLMKRVRYLNTLIEKLNLTNVTAIQGRAEDIGRNTAYREQYDIAVSRAVASLSPLCEYCLPLVKIGGDFIAYKSNKAEEEIEEAKKAINTLGGKIVTADEFLMTDHSSDDTMERTLIDIRKIKHTPAAYPRKAGTPTKKPL
jgi:16S rRNA (guanine527-N7)-methyltransferase